MVHIFEENTKNMKPKTRFDFVSFLQGDSHVTTTHDTMKQQLVLDIILWNKIKTVFLI